MTSFIRLRQPFGILDESRLQTLGSIKNRQNAIPTFDKLTPSKDSGKPGNKRRHSPPAEEFDSENVDPNILHSKRSKVSDGTPHKASKFSLVDSISVLQQSSLNTPSNTPNNASLKRKQLSLSVPAPTNKTPIAHSRGSPKHKRVGILSKQRRFSSSPFRRVDPPSYNAGGASTGLPFSIDAALSGTISSYKPAQPEVAAPMPAPEPLTEKPMPKTWFFEIHEDTPEEEAANLMEHSAATLDISSDDDCESRRLKTELERGKENIPPPDWVAQTRASRPTAAIPVHKGVSRKKKLAAAIALADAMLEDRSALGALTAEDFYPEGLDEHSAEIVDSPVKQMPTTIAEGSTFDFAVPALPAKTSDAPVDSQADIVIRPDSPVASDS